MSPSMWDRADALIDSADSVEALRIHRLALLAEARWRGTGRCVPAELQQERRRAAFYRMAAPGLLARARDAYDGPLMLMKGPEVAACYRTPEARSFKDLDFLAPAAEVAQRALITAGFIERVPDRDHSKLHHLSELAYPGVPLGIEVHRIPKLPAWLPAPSVEELFATAVPSATGIDGVLAPAPAAHALLLAAHAWAHHPFGRIGDLIDIAAALGSGGRPEADVLAQEWGWGSLWDATTGAIDALLGEDRAPLRLRLAGRHLLEMRALTVFEFHVARFSAPALTSPARRIPGALRGALRELLVPWDDETWGDKLTRMGRAVRNASIAKSAHDENPFSR